MPPQHYPQQPKGGQNPGGPAQLCAATGRRTGAAHSREALQTSSPSIPHVPELNEFSQPPGRNTSSEAGPRRRARPEAEAAVGLDGELAPETVAEKPATCRPPPVPPGPQRHRRFLSRDSGSLPESGGGGDSLGSRVQQGPDWASWPADQCQPFRRTPGGLAFAEGTRGLLPGVPRVHTHKRRVVRVLEKQGMPPVLFS